MTAPVPTDLELVPVLQAVQHGDDLDVLLDNSSLAAALGRSLADVAHLLAAAKSRSYIWGVSSGQRPGPWYSELELTVQGRRFLASHVALP